MANAAPGERGLEHYLSALEKQENVTIVAAWLAGSHAWGTADAESDYDIRFVFTQPTTAYASLTRRTETINSSGDSLTAGVPTYARAPGRDVELHGWQARRFLELLLDDNPAAIECINNPHCLRGHPVLDDLRSHVAERFNPIELYDHYQSFAKKNYHKYIVEEDEQTVKKNLYVVRACLYAEYVRCEHELPTLNFPKFLDTAPEAVLDGWDDEALTSLIDEKRAGNGGTHIGDAFEEQVQSVLNRELDYQQHIPDTVIDAEFVDDCMFDILSACDV